MTQTQSGAPLTKAEKTAALTLAKKLDITALAAMHAARALREEVEKGSTKAHLKGNL